MSSKDVQDEMQYFITLALFGAATIEGSNISVVALIKYNMDVNMHDLGQGGGGHSSIALSLDTTHDNVVVVCLQGRVWKPHIHILLPLGKWPNHCRFKKSIRGHFSMFN